MNVLQHSFSRSHLRPWAWFLFAALTILLLTACGGKVNTDLSVNDDGSGERKMTVVVSDESLAKVKGGQASIEKAIADFKPAELNYGGVKREGNNSVFSFSIPFKSLSEYATKVDAIRSAGGTSAHSARARAEISKGVEPFSSGSSYSENFTSNQLLAWIVAVLEKQGKIASSDSGNALSTGENVLKYGGQETKAAQPFAVGKVEKHQGLSSVQAYTSGLGTGKYTRTLQLGMDRIAYLGKPEAFDKYFADRVPSGSTVKKHDDGVSIIWDIQFPAGTPDQVNEYMNSLLSSESSRFQVSDPAPGEDPLTFTATVADNFSCRVVCGGATFPHSTLELGPGWTGPGEYEFASGKRGIDIYNRPPLEVYSVVSYNSQKLDIALNPRGGGSATLRVVFGKEEEAKVKDAIAQWLQGESKAKASREEVRDGVAYSVTVKGEDAKALSKQLEIFGFTGAPIELRQIEKSTLRDGYLVGLRLGLPNRIAIHAKGLELPLTVQIKGEEGLSFLEPTPEIKQAGWQLKDGQYQAEIRPEPGHLGFVFLAKAEVNRTWILWASLGGFLLFLALVIIGVLFFVKRKFGPSKPAGAAGGEAAEGAAPTSAGTGAVQETHGSDASQAAPTVVLPTPEALAGEGVPGVWQAAPYPGSAGSDQPTERLDLAPPVNDNLTQPLPNLANLPGVETEAVPSLPDNANGETIGGEEATPALSETADEQEYGESDPERDTTKDE
ncbi:hypothetical protein ACUH92_05550 [Dermabacteraceae bacterium CCM 9520]